MALRQKRKEVAMSHLRERKLYEDLLKKRLSSLDTLRATLVRVEAAAGDVEVSSIHTIPEALSLTEGADHEVL